MSKADTKAPRPLHVGGCLCGAVRYQIDGDLAPIQICHCEDCRKAQGSAFATNIPVAVERFRLTAGAANLKAYESSPGKERVFCSQCGSPLFSRLIDLPYVLRIRAGALDSGTPAEVGFHFHTASKAAWWRISDDLPQYPGPRPAP